MIKTFKQASNYLNSFTNLEKNSDYCYKESLKLERVKKIAAYLNIPYKNLNAIHVAGTKGKGSTSHFLAYCLASLGYKVGVFSSPHFFSFRERIKTLEYKDKNFKEQLISRSRVTAILAGFQQKLNCFCDEKPTYFELITLLGFKFFSEKKLDYVVVEVGLGGRLDSTNIIFPKLAVITHIGYDHMHLLGNSLAEIAYEKAGIIKEKVPVVSCYQRKLAMDTIEKTARKKQAPLYRLGSSFEVGNLKINKNHTFFDFSFKQLKIEKLKIHQKGQYQTENAGLALAAAYLTAGKVFDRRQVKLALRRCVFEGRFELLLRQPLVVVDVAHNKSSALVVADNLKKYFPKKEIILIFACASDKKPNHMLSLIKYRRLILTQFDHPRSYNVFELRNILWRKKALITNSVSQALDKAFSLYNKDSLILVCGSFFLAAQAKAIIKKRKKNLFCLPVLTGQSSYSNLTKKA